jgi:methyl-accepting chemotaxis protein
MRNPFHSINGRVLLIPVVALAALILAGAASVRTIADITLTEHQARARAVAEAASKIVEAYEAKAARGEMTDDQAQEAAKVALRAIRYDGSEYVMARREDGVITINGLFPDREGAKSYDNKDSAGAYFSRDMITKAEDGGGFNYYFWPKQPNTPPVRKATYSLLTPRWKWVVGSGVYLDEVDEATWNNALNTVGIVAAVALVTFALAFWLGHRITRPIVRLTEATHRLADGDLAVAIPGAERRDEIGTMAQAVVVLKQRSAEATRLAAEQGRLKAETVAERQRAMRDLAGGFETSFKAVIDGIAASATEMEASAKAMSSVASTAGGEASLASAAAEQTSANVGTVASATEEMASSVSEISRQVQDSARMASGAVDQARATNDRVSELSKAASRIGDVVELINTIAGQTNLLALNATIEAARAGEFGRGFAVVASEVKALAEQTAKATGEIGQQVAGIQAATEESVNAIKGIGGTIEKLSEIASAIAAAVEQQGAATQEIARNVQQAANGTRQVSSNVGAARRAAAETEQISANVLSAAATLSQEAERLRADVTSFLSGIRAA